jgi:carboxyl-terminal processing protease
MKSKMKGTGRRLMILLMFLPLTIIFWGFGNDFFEYGKQLEIFSDVYKEVNQYYVDEINPGDLMKTGINGMLNNLDPYTNYYPESEIEDYRIKHVSAEYGGIGASSFRTGDSVIVYDVIEGYPAQKSDLRAGDVILAVGGRSLSGLTTEEVDDLLKGQSGTVIKLSVGRYGEAQPLEKSITREDIKVNNVSYYGMLNDSTGYIKLDKFLQNCFNEVHDALVDLKKNPSMNALVFDLRGNGGGLLEESVNILNLFIDKGQLLVTQKGKLSGSNNVYIAKNDPVDAKIRVAVLVDKHSASASEVTAGNFQDVDRGIVVGQRSYGKGLVQQTRPLSYNSQLKVTVAKYSTASGRCVQTKVYTHRGEEGNMEELPDSIIKSFKTKNGRTVYDASAVFPDRYVQLPDTSNIAKSLIRRMLIFDYASRYRTLKPSIDSAATFKLSDEDYKDFMHFVEAKNYDYTTQTELAFKDLKETVIKDKYYAGVNNELEGLGKKLMHNKEDDLINFKSEIKRLLEEEIVSRYYYKTGRFKYTFQKDPVLKEALTVLGNPVLYNSILAGEGSYKIIGTPSKN